MESSTSILVLGFPGDPSWLPTLGCSHHFHLNDPKGSRFGCKTHRRVCRPPVLPHLSPPSRSRHWQAAAERPSHTNDSAVAQLQKTSIPWRAAIQVRARTRFSMAMYYARGLSQLRRRGGGRGAKIALHNKPHKACNIVRLALHQSMPRSVHLFISQAYSS